MTATIVHDRLDPDRYSRWLSIITLLFSLALGAPGAQAGAACVVAKKHGNSLAIEWAAHPDASVELLVQELKRRLREQGYGQDRYEDLFPQANTDLAHGHVVIVRTEYVNARGKPRVSYGCGYSDQSAHEAEWAALRDLQSYSWGWVPSKGHEVIGQFRY